MPKLDYPKITKGDAICYLVECYLQNKTFITEYSNIRDPYAKLLSSFYQGLMAFWSSKEYSARDYYQSVIDYYEGKNRKDPFPFENFPQVQDLQPFFDNLHDLTWRWKLRAPWAVFAVVYFDYLAYHFAQGWAIKKDMTPEQLNNIFPWQPPVAPLIVEIPAWSLIEEGREEVLKKIGKQLVQYEENMRTAGLNKEYPSSLGKHAQWWYQHFVLNAKYDDIAQNETYLPGGSLISYSGNVGAAVRRFSSLVDIKLKDLK